MAFKLTKEEIKAFGEKLASLRDEWNSLDEAHTKLANVIELAMMEFREAAREFDEALGAARSEAEQIRDRLQGEYDDKSDKWKEGDKAQDVERLIDRWSEIVDSDLAESYEPSIQDPETPEMVEIDLDTLEGFPHEVGDV